MNRRFSRIALRTLCLTALLLLACAACAQKTYTVTFSVNGSDTVCTVAAGEVPAYPGSLDPITEGDIVLTFAGWDQEITPAAGDAHYTAIFTEETVTPDVPVYTVYWVTVDGDLTTEVREGDTPVPPEIQTTVITDKMIYTFREWNRTPEPLTAENAVGQGLVFRAKYNKEERMYTVRFLIDGKETATVQAKYGEYVSYPGELPEREGYQFCSFTNTSAGITGDTVCEAVFTKNNADVLMTAYNTSLLSFDPTPGRHDNYGGVLAESSALLYMLLEIRQSPDGLMTEDFAARVAESLSYMMSEKGETPFFSLEPYWCYCTLTAAVAVAHETPLVWDKLTAEEQEKYDFLMESFAYILAFGTSDENNYQTGPGLRGNYAKTWNPNYRLAVVTPMLFVSQYFGGADAVNEILANFSYDDTVARFTKYGWDRAVAEWTAELPTLADGTTAPSQKEFMENGGPAYLADRNDADGERLGITAGKAAGSGVGVRVAYTYSGYTLDQVAEIFNTLLRYNYSGGAVVSTYGKYDDGTPKAYILDGSTSPYEGRDGMMLEFCSGDGGGIRSSCAYTSHDFIMICAALAAMEELDMYDLRRDGGDLADLVWVGNMDFLYKYTHGYMSFSLGSPYESNESTSVEYTPWKAWWIAHFSEWE